MCTLQNAQKLKTVKQENHPPQSRASYIYTDTRESVYNHICLMIVSRIRYSQMTVNKTQQESGSSIILH